MMSSCGLGQSSGHFTSANEDPEAIAHVVYRKKPIPYTIGLISYGRRNDLERSNLIDAQEL